MPKDGQKFPFVVKTRITSGCSKKLSSKAAASEEARRTLRYVEPLRDARTPLADFSSILLGYMRVILRYDTSLTIPLLDPCRPPDHLA